MASHPLFRVRYWRTYPWPLQLLLLLLLVMTLASLMTALAFVLVPALTGQTTTSIAGVTADSPRAVVHGALWYQALSSAGLFLLPAFLFAYLSHPAPLQYLGLRAPGRREHWIWVSGSIIGATPLFLGLESLTRLLLPANSRMQQANDTLTKAFLDTHSLPELLGVLVVVAVVAPLGEELFFRGVLFRFVSKRSRGLLFPVVASAVFFAAIHGNPAGMPAIFLAGALLVLFYWLTGSLWCSIVAHCIYNGSQALLIYAARDHAGLRTILEADFLPLGVTIAGAGLFLFCFNRLWRSRTPLPPGWASDTAEPAAASPIR